MNNRLIAELARVLKTTEGNALKRAHAMKLTPVCGRCGGCGQYSFNQVDGTRCYGCAGVGHVLPRDKDLPGVLEAAKAAVAEGRLEQYFAEIEARKVAKRGSDRIFEVWGKTHAARVWKGWASHVFGHPNSRPEYQLPGNHEAVRAANAEMSALYHRAEDAMRAVRFASPANPGYGEMSLAAAQAVELAVKLIAEADVEPDKELAEFAAAQQRRAAESIRAKGYKPGFEIYGEEEADA